LRAVGASVRPRADSGVAVAGESVGLDVAVAVRVDVELGAAVLVWVYVGEGVLVPV